MIDYSEQFDKERKYRVEVSYHKYGSARKNFGEGRVDAIATAERCIEAFKRDHNTEHLVDAANYLMFRFMFPMPGEFLSLQTVPAALARLVRRSTWRGSER